MFENLTGTALQSAQMVVARYCLNLARQSGSIDIGFVVTNINKEYRLVTKDALNALIHDVTNAYNYLSNQQSSEMSRAGYWKFKMLSPFEAKIELANDLASLGA